MLYFSIHSLFKMRGIENPYTDMVKAGISPHSASNLLNNKINSIHFGHLEKLCILLNCTPNDLLVWKANAHAILPDKHALTALRHQAEEGDLYQALRKLPLHELKNIAGLVHNKANLPVDKEIEDDTPDK